MNQVRGQVWGGALQGRGGHWSLLLVAVYVVRPPCPQFPSIWHVACKEVHLQRRWVAREFRGPRQTKRFVRARMGGGDVCWSRERRNTYSVARGCALLGGGLESSQAAGGTLSEKPSTPAAGRRNSAKVVASTTHLL